MTDTTAFQPTHYLRVEGVNLGPFVFDTRDLSTTRGSSLLLLNMVDRVSPVLPDGSAAVSQGASIGLWQVFTTDPAALAVKVQSMLENGEYRHGTFVVDLIPVGEFRMNMESLLAANRWRQMQGATLSVPAASATEPYREKNTCCALDGLRESVFRDDHKIQNQQMSTATRDRREYGRNQKQSFYQARTGIRNLAFVSEFSELADTSGKLAGKMAVFYADGNSFGGIAAGCRSKENLTEWDAFMRGSRKHFLTRFLTDEASQTEWKHGEKIRFETLLWGGDELMFVMPASLGWRFSRLFFDFFGNDKFAFGGQKLTHTASIVFCQHHSPIHRIKHLLKDGMAEFAKKKNRERDQLVCVALESFDHLGTSYQSSMEKRYRSALPVADSVLFRTGSTDLAKMLMMLAEGIGELKQPSSEFARSQLRALAVALIHPDLAKPVSAELDKALDSHFFRAEAGARNRLKALGELFPSPAALWIQLEELWDYALP